MALTVLSVAYPLAPIGPNAVGGAEQVLTQLDAALTRAGHHSIVIACEGSRTEGTFIATPGMSGVLDETAKRIAAEHHARVILEALGKFRIDVIHLHGIDFHRYLPGPGVPALVTLHLPPHWYPPQVFHLSRPVTFLNCVSAAQRRSCPACPYMLPEIENGVAAELFSGHHAKRSFVVGLGRVCPEKGFHIALDAAARAGVSMLLAGAVFPYAAHEDYFQREILPRLGDSRRFIGPVGWKHKRRLLSAARCLLVPSLVPETSSLVAMEALACGTPVVAFPAGALTEIVEPGRTGLLVHNEREMAEAIRASSSLDSGVCRQSARERFSLSRMVEKYFAVYRDLAHSGHRTVFQKEANECHIRGNPRNSGRGSDHAGATGTPAK